MAPSEKIDLPPQPGTYMLQLEALEASQVPVGKLGVLDVAPGWYLYVGSARGPGGLRARVRRHARVEGKRLHWHVDYLRIETRLRAIWYARGTERRECQWAQALRALAQTNVPLEGFGASDCACAAHLVAVSDLPSRATLQEEIEALDPSTPPIRKLVLD